MKKTLLFVTVSVASLLTLILTGCSKKDSSSPYTMKSLAGSYKLTSANISAAGQNFDWLALMDDCEKDDILTLTADSTFTYTDAGVTCTPDGSYTGKWYVSGNYLIQVDEDNDKDTVTIKSFNGTNLVVTTSDEYMGTPATLTSTLTSVR